MADNGWGAGLVDPVVFFILLMPTLLNAAKVCRRATQWTRHVNGARIAVAAPWLLLAALSLHPQAVRAYNSTAGALVIAFGGGLSIVAYRVMIRIGRLPVEERVLR